MFRNSFFAATMLLLVSFVCRATDTGGFHYRDVTTTKAGELATLLGDDLLNIDSLVVRGPINDADFNTMKQCCLSGKLSTLNIEYSNIEKGIPEMAFFKCEKLSRIILPEEIPLIGDYAFVSTGLREIILPENFNAHLQSGVFSHCKFLSKAALPLNMTVVPSAIFDGCSILKEIELSYFAEKIGRRAFAGTDLKNIALPDYTEQIGAYAFSNIPDCRSIVLPGFLRSIGYGCFQGTKLPAKIYSYAPAPPGCEMIDNVASMTESSKIMSPFQYDENTTVNTTTTVYVPIGSGDLYRRTPGWDYFTNIVEIDFSGIDDITVDSVDGGDGAIYDLSGRRVANPVEGQIYIMNGKKFVYKM